MDFLQPYVVDCGDNALGQQPAIQSLREVHIGAASCKLLQQRFMLRTGQKIGVQQLDLLLTVPKLRKVSGLDTPAPFLVAHNAKRTRPWTAPCQEAIGHVRKSGINAVIRARVFNFRRQILSYAITRAAVDYPVCVRDCNIVLGVKLGKDLAFIGKVVPSLWGPPLHRVAPRLMPCGQLH